MLYLDAPIIVAHYTPEQINAEMERFILLREVFFLQ